MKKTLFAMLVAAPLIAQAGASDRGGGNAVVCFKSPGTSTEILNPANPHKGHILNRHLSDIAMVTTYDLANMNAKAFPTKEGESHLEYIERLALRFETHLPQLAAFLRTIHEGWSDEIDRKDSPLYRMNDENDSGPIDPERCVISTMAVQSDVGSETQLTLDTRLFEHPTHTLLSRHALMFHEYLYRIFRRTLGDKDSKRTRTVVQIVMEDGVPLEKIRAKLLNVAPGFMIDMNNFELGATPVDEWHSKLFGWNMGLLEMMGYNAGNARELHPLYLSLDTLSEGNLEIKGIIDHLKKVSEEGRAHVGRVNIIEEWTQILEKSKRYRAMLFVGNRKVADEMQEVERQITAKLEKLAGDRMRAKLVAQARSSVGSLPLNSIQRKALIGHYERMSDSGFYCFVLFKHTYGSSEGVRCQKLAAMESKRLHETIKNFGIKL